MISVVADRPLIEQYTMSRNLLTRYVCFYRRLVSLRANACSKHPGGDEVILAEAGMSRALFYKRFPSSPGISFPGIDATEAFEDVGHSDEARGLLPDMLVGTFDKGSTVRIRLFYPIQVTRVNLYIYLQNMKLFDDKKESSAAVNVAVQQGSKYVVLPTTAADRPVADQMPFTRLLFPPSVMYFVPLALLGAYFAWRFYSSSSA